MAHSLEITEGRIHDFGQPVHDVPVVPVGTLLVDLAQVFAAHDGRYALVCASDGQLTGVVSLDDLRDAIRSCAEPEQDAWHHRTVESLLAVTLSADAGSDEGSRSADADRAGSSALSAPYGPTHESPSSGRGEESRTDCLSVREGADLVALMTREDVLLSWNRLEPALARAATDALTRLPNRQHFERRFQEEWQRASRLNLTLGLMVIDVDHFKEINDAFGHLRGDLVLASVAECCQRHLRSYDLVARFAGDEFVALTSGCQAADIELPIRRLQESVRNLGLQFNGRPVPASLSIGAAVATAGAPHIGRDDLFEAADACLYRAKREGRDRACCLELTQTETRIDISSGQMIH